MLDSIPLPAMYRVRQKFDSSHIKDIPAKVRAEMRAFLAKNDLRDKRVCVTVGSRGISHNAEIVKAIVRAFQEAGALPFLIPAMGSHGGATAEGQLAMIRHVGVDPDEIGVPCVSTMDADCIGALDDGTPLYCASDTMAADGIFLLNKIKPHADFKGPYESGLIKMMVIGLGKHKGCSALHQLGFSRFAELLPAAAKVVLEKAPILGGLAIVENAYDQPQIIEALGREEIFPREKELQVIAKNNVAVIKTDRLDTLIIDEIGKNISGEGMDPNVTGRPGSELQEGFDRIRIGSIVIRDVTDVSDGNGAGIGMADIATHACVSKLNLGAMYTNSITAGILGPSRLPVILGSDLEAVKVSLRVSAGDHLGAPRVARIRNTVQLDEILISEALLPEFTARDDVQLLGREDFCFDEQENLLPDRVM